MNIKKGNFIQKSVKPILRNEKFWYSSEYQQNSFDMLCEFFKVQLNSKIGNFTYSFDPNFF